MNIAEYSIQKRTITLVLTFLAVFGGLQSYQNLGRLEDPEFTIKDAVITTHYPGASAAEVEAEVTNVIEKACQQLGQLKEIESVSYRGKSIVTPTIKDKYDKFSLPQVWDELRRKVNDAQSELPPGAGPSLVNDDFGDVYGIYFAITGDGYSYKEIKDFADLLNTRLDYETITERAAAEESATVFTELGSIIRVGAVFWFMRGTTAVGYWRCGDPTGWRRPRCVSRPCLLRRCFTTFWEVGSPFRPGGMT